MRKCIKCGKEIHECMGFQLARDFNLALNNKIKWIEVREHCGICAIKYENDNEYWSKLK